MKYQKGFTLIESIIVITCATLLIALFFIQKSNIDAMFRDETRKTAINAFYYSLENDFYAHYGYYPEQISPEILPTVSPELWVDPSGHAFNDPESSYKYTPANCDNGTCKEYTLTATLEKETAFVKTNSEH